MTEKSGYKVRELLPASMDNMTDELRQEIATDIGARDGNLVFGFLASQALDVIDGALDIDLFEVLARGWSVIRELREFSDETKHPPGRLATVSFSKHDFTTTLFPVLTYQIGMLTPPPLKFTLELTAQIKSVKLDILQHRLVAVGAGEGRVSALLKYGKVPLHSKLESRNVPLSGRYKLKAPGFEIARPRQ